MGISITDGSERLPLSSLAWAGMGIGSAMGAFFAVLDLFCHGVTLAPFDALQFVVLCVFGSACLGLPACIAATVGCRYVFRGLSDAVVLAALAGVGVQVTFVLLFEGNVLIVTAPLPWLLTAVVFRVFRRLGLRWLWRGFFSVAMGVTVGAAGGALMMPVAAGASGSALALGTVSVVAVILTWLAHQRTTLALIVTAVGLGLMYLTGGASPSWRGTDATAMLAPDPPKPLPNIVLMVLDTTRRDHLGCYGDPRGLTPRIDAFAAESVVYADMISPSPWTPPSHASMFTGYYPVTHGCSNEHHRWLDSGFETLAEMLMREGYQTVAVVNNEHLQSSNLLQGFQTYLNPWGAREPLVATRWTTAAGFPTRWADHGAADSVEAVSDWLSRHRDGRRPFFLFVNLMESHWPHFPPAAYRARWLPEDMGYLGASLVSSGFFGVHWMAGKPHTARDEAAIRGLYGAAVAYQDEQVGRLLEGLSAGGDLDDTLVMVTADHGEGLGEGGRWDHVFALTDALIRVPMIIRYPRIFPPGLNVDGGCQLIDVIPTVFDVLQRPVSVAGLPGRTLVPQRFKPREATFAQTSPYYGHLERMQAFTGFDRDITEYTAHLRSIRTGRFKFVWSSRGEHELYDLVADPSEVSNVIEAHREVAADFERELARWWSDQPAYVPRPKSDSSPLDGDALDALRSIGYVGGR